MIVCDTNILIELYKNNPAIVTVVESIGQNNVAISDVTRAELLVGALNKRELQTLIKDTNQLYILPVRQEISSMSISLSAKYCLSHSLDFHDALIAATVIYHRFELFTLNTKDFAYIPDIKMYKT